MLRRRQRADQHGRKHRSPTSLALASSRPRLGERDDTRDRAVPVVRTRQAQVPLHARHSLEPSKPLHEFASSRKKSGSWLPCSATSIDADISGVDSVASYPENADPLDIDARSPSGAQNNARPNLIRLRAIGTFDRRGLPRSCAHQQRLSRPSSLLDRNRAKFRRRSR